MTLNIKKKTLFYKNAILKNERRYTRYKIALVLVAELFWARYSRRGRWPGKGPGISGLVPISFSYVWNLSSVNGLLDVCSNVVVVAAVVVVATVVVVVVLVVLVDVVGSFVVVVVIVVVAISIGISVVVVDVEVAAVVVSKSAVVVAVVVVVVVTNSKLSVDFAVVVVVSELVDDVSLAKRSSCKSKV